MNMAYQSVIYKAEGGRVMVRGSGDPRWRQTLAPLTEGDEQFDRALEIAREQRRRHAGSRVV